MPYHRILTVPAAEVVKDDVILHYDNNRRVQRDVVDKVEFDHQDMTVFIVHAGNEEGKFYSLYEHVKLDCLLTFGQNSGKGL